MKRTASLALAALVMAACTEDNVTVSHSDNSTAAVSRAPYLAEDGTRAEINPLGTSVAFSWQQDDQLAVYSDGSGMTNFNIKSIDASDPAHAIFQANGFNLKGGSTYHAFFPYEAGATDKASVLVSYEGMVQASDNAYSHLGSYDYQYATATAAGSTDAADIQFRLDHLGAICRFRITGVPAGVRFSRFSLSQNGIVTEGTINLSTKVLTATQNSTSTQNIMLGDDDGTGFAAAADGTLTLYAMMAPADLSGGSMTFRLYSDRSDMYVYETTLSGKNMTGGKALGYTRAYSSVPTPAETDEWVDLGLTRKDGTPILFGKHNLGYTQEVAVGSKPAWTVADPVPAVRGTEWRTPSISELRALFNKEAAGYPLTWEKASDESGVWVINTSMEAVSGQQDHRIFLPFTSDQKGLYWSSTASVSFWPNVMMVDNDNLEATRERALYYGTEVLSSGDIRNASSRMSALTENMLAIRPVYVGPTGGSN